MTKPCDLIAVIQALYTRLQAGETPPPWPELEQICHQTPEDFAPAVLREPCIQAIRPALQALRAAYEYELEKTAALHLLQQPDPTAAFGAFGMYERYVRVVALEMALIRQFQAMSPLKALFIGSGPLPVTALLLAEKWDCRVDCLDRSREACELGAAVAQALRLDERLHFHCADVFDVTDLTHYDAVFVAALVGLTEKARVVQHLARQLRPGQVLTLRAGRGLRTLLYEDINEADLHEFDVRTASALGVTQVEIVGCKR